MGLQTAVRSLREIIIIINFLVSLKCVVIVGTLNYAKAQSFSALTQNHDFQVLKRYIE